MDRRTLGGKKKLTFQPKLPTEPLEEQIVEKPTEKPVEKKETKRKEEKPVLMGGRTEEKAFGLSLGNSEEITTEDLLRIENSPITVEKIENKIKSREVEGGDNFIKNYKNRKVILQLPFLLPEEGEKFIRGKLVIKNSKIYIRLIGRISENSQIKEFLFKIEEIETGMPQEGLKIEGNRIERTGQIERKFVSSIVSRE